MNIWKKLFPDPPPPEQIELDLGVISAYVKLHNDEEYNFEFKGEYSGSTWEKWFDGVWFDDYFTAQDRFDTWKQKIKDSGFLRISDKVLFPMHEIYKVTALKGELKTTTTRAR